ncbi:50S ribosomal protein L23 [Spirochaeta africana]|uniref:Large ribosomal subunit protein uL23 n=1 Tax=Spirochaeta africana (strain ATCC 700263 / DSM 8902 / Z-7692) TaxID=889378 RepID=H9UGL4_SPIAZ|nr:50S ribosomal protein L23 [Spirochaeta africana]AFG36657.1 ribosomal protein L23 [Spirochaeta africana DSM 8902]
MKSKEVIIEPILTEKTNDLREKNQFVFRVDARANKIEVIQAVQSIFNVTPIGCNIINVKGKPRRVRYQVGRTPSWKKAIVTLKSGDSIPLFEGV